MSGRSSPVNSGYEGQGTEPALRLSVRKDLFPEVRLTKLDSVATAGPDDLERVSCVSLETDFEQSIDDIANQKLVANGEVQSRSRYRHQKEYSKHDVKHSTLNGCFPSKRIKKSSESNHRTASSKSLRVKGGKNLNLVSSSECQNDDDEELSALSDSSEDEILKCSVKLPIAIPRQSGKPYSHELSQLSTKKSKSKLSKKKQTVIVPPCSGKPRSMLDMCSSRSKKKVKKSDSNISNTTYRSQIVDTHNLKIKIKRTRIDETVPPTPISIADLGQRKSKKKRAASPVASESSGEEYDPSRGESAAAMSVAAPKTKHPKNKIRKSNNSKNKNEKTEKTRGSGAESKDSGPQSPWADRIPEEILTKIFEHVVVSQGTLPAMVRLGKVCKRWYNVSCKPELWKNVDLAQYTSEKCKTDYKLVWLLENRLTKCQSLNIAQWKVCNISWVLACVTDYCADLVELSVAGWSRVTPEQLFELMQGLPKLQRIDLSLTSETGGSGTCLSAASMARLMENFGSRLTHLTLANNKFTALPQILASVAAHCKNLEVLDISGAQATSHPASVPLEALQNGCPKMRVFRAANAQLVLATVPSTQQVETEGWTQLEELSIAGEVATERASVGKYRLGDDALSRLVRGATALRLLDLRGLQRLTDSGLVRVPAWDLQHLFLGGCNVLRQSNACLDLICEKWCHSLIELDLSWASAAKVLDDAVSALVESKNSKLRILNLCGSAVSLDSVKKVLTKCLQIESLNLSSCRALPRGMKRHYTGKELQDLKDSFDPAKSKAKEEAEKEKSMKKKGRKKSEVEEKPESSFEKIEDNHSKSSVHTDAKSETDSTFQEPKQITESEVLPKTEDTNTSVSNPKTHEAYAKTENESNKQTPSNKSITPTLLSPAGQSKPDSSSTPTSDLNSPGFSPASKPDMQVQTSPEVQTEFIKSNLWNLGQFKTTPTHRSEASPLNRSDTQSKLKHDKFIEQCSPTTSLENKPSPETVGIKQDIKNVSGWNYGSYSPMPRQDTPFSSQCSPYSAQPSPAQPSPYSTQPSPYSTQPSPYSSQPSPYSAQPSPDTSQIVKPDLQKPQWNTGNFSPMPKHHAPFSPHPSTHTSPDPGPGLKVESLRSNSKTAGQYSPMSRQERVHQSSYSPRSSVDNVAYNNKKSPAGMGNFSPMMRPDCHITSPDGSQTPRTMVAGRTQDVYNRSMAKVPEVIPTEMPSMWTNVDRYNTMGNDPTNAIESFAWSGSSLGSERSQQPRMDTRMLNTPVPQSRAVLPPFETSVRRSNNEISDSWTLGQFRVEPPLRQSDFMDQNVNFDSLNIGPHMLQNYLDDSYIERSRVD